MAKRAKQSPPAPLAAPGGWGPAWSAAGFAVAAAVLLYSGARPIVDTDLWYHLAYARQMLESGRLTLDHTAFSWTPSDNAVIYCAWFSQLGLYGLHQLFGLPALFVLRYAVLAVPIAAAGVLAYQGGVIRHPLTWALALVAVLMSSAAMFIKPQLISYALMTATVLLWMMVRRRGDDAWRWLYALPVLMLVWVNTHGGFIVGLAYLGIALAGEHVNAWLSPSRAASPVLRRHLLGALALCAVAVFATPYGWRYPAQFFTVSLPAVDLAAVREYDSIFAPAQRGLRYLEYGAAAAALLLALAARRRLRDIDWALVFTNLAFAGLYAYYVRLTFFWAPVALLSGIALLAERPRWCWPESPGSRRAISAAIVAATLLLAFGAVRADGRTPVVGGWRGFGNGYWNPEEEAEYIARHFQGVRLGNDYNAGGYLIWRLWPGTRVFMDARYFPYRSWFADYLRLETTDGIDQLLQRFPADVWCIELLLPKTVAWFRTSPAWEPAFYGSSAVVFVKRGTALPGGRLQTGSGIGEIRNLYQALLVLAFAFDVRDLPGAERVVAGMERRFDAEHERPVVAGARTALDGVLAHQRGDHENAVRLLTDVAAAYQGVPAAALLDSALQLTARHWQADDVAQALRLARFAAQIAPQSPVSRYNAGVIGWWQQQQSPNAGDLAWREDLTTFLALAPRDDPGLARPVDTATRIVQGQGTGRPVVLTPGR